MIELTTEQQRQQDQALGSLTTQIRTEASSSGLAVRYVQLQRGTDTSWAGRLYYEGSDEYEGFVVSLDD